MVNLLSYSTAETRRLGKILGREILKTKNVKTALVLRLEGDLGSGKTTFLQGLAKGLGVAESVLSPTFIIMRKLKIRENSRSNPRQFANFYHFDCYRLSGSQEIEILDFKKIIADPRNVVVLEWADRVARALPRNAIFIKFQFINRTTRLLRFGS